MSDPTPNLARLRGIMAAATPWTTSTPRKDLEALANTLPALVTFVETIRDYRADHRHETNPFLALDTLDRELGVALGDEEGT